MTRDEFIAEYHKVSARAIHFSEKARREGLLALEEDIINESSIGRDILRIGLRLVVDGTDRDIIEKILINIIQQEEDKYTRLLMEIKKETVLSIWEGLNPRNIALILNSLTDISYTDDPIFQKYKEEEDEHGVFSEDEIKKLLAGRAKNE
jgi:flagellar motor component MotA